ncbi:hypothetical protein EYD45_11445 [Hyunsoonleella flava]|uniref:Uncharacterized protein n=1 Tax=Hyunsoonleella flava TaxID=2527939 RepID=A0A4Q9FEY5_9FLAO|nr:hypothetical protein [Hyunsoonleella flava]TBN02732.1 hypothetical protein EYD45_11445 [Hyunsoonleella flava]
MIKKISFFVVCIFCFFNTQCDEDEVVVDFDNLCDDTVIIDEGLYNNLISDSFLLSKVEIIDDCLNIELGASGCDGSTWEFRLVDSGAVAESLPEQRYLKFQFVNKEDCLAAFERNVSFNLKPLQIDNGVNKVILNIEGWESSLTYSY